ncbi:glycerophosphodiester phosphodiesterase family protein [Moellerella wisconsensis]|uniref:Uncharacterized protein n=1 Tax=Moellerella wisconsensis TaxID=158849 RepID=A0ACD3YAV0_9GAMM|nr:glycerophosphodiester phosphodiesterase family protein [Moellerella wisconsensis]UNH39994.1 hypothetical protein MNY70_06000 [Moellerella wisconsensis]
MTTYNTRNKVGSPAAKDLFDNSENFDKAINDRESEIWVDRLGVERVSLFGAEKKNERLVEKFKVDMNTAIITAGYAPVGTFQEGAKLEVLNEIVLWRTPDGDGDSYKWTGPFPKTVPANSTPASTGGIKTESNPTGLWVSVGDASLRGDLRRDGFDIVSDGSVTLSEALDSSGKKISEASYKIEQAKFINNTSEIEVIAHRGFRDSSPQNSMLALSTAKSLGATSLECDVQVTSDGHLVVFHDDDMGDLMTISGQVKELPLSVVQSARFKSMQGSPYADEGIPLFDDVLALAKSQGVKIYPEIKRYRSVDDVKLFVGAVESADMVDNVVMQAFGWGDLLIVKQLNPAINIGYLGANLSTFDHYLAELSKMQPASILLSSSAFLAIRDCAKKCREAGVGVGVWTITTNEQVQQLMAAGCNRLMSDIPLSN